MASVLERLKLGIQDVKVTYGDGSVYFFKCTANHMVLRNRGLPEDGIYNLNRNRKLFEDEVDSLEIMEYDEVDECSELDKYINKGL